MAKTKDPAWWLHDAVRRLIEPRTVKLIRDSGGTDRTKVASLWDELLVSTETGGENQRAGNKYRTPLKLELLDLRDRIRKDILTDLGAYRQAPHYVGESFLIVSAALIQYSRATAQRAAEVTYGIPRDKLTAVPSVPDLRHVDVPASLRRLALAVASTNDQDAVEDMTERIKGWIEHAREVLGLNDQPKPRRMRDSQCPVCLATHVTETIDGQPTRVPALMVDFSDGRIRAAECSACGAAWFRGEALWSLSDNAKAFRERQDAIARQRWAERTYRIPEHLLTPVDTPGHQDDTLTAS